MSDLSEILDPLDRPIWSAEAFGLVIQRTEAQVFHLLERGLLDADKVGGRWTSTPRRLLKSLARAAERDTAA